MPSAFVSNLPMALAKVVAESQKALRSAADVGRNQTVKNLTGARSGRQYKVPGTSVTYTASAPGEFPAVQTGQLRSNVRIRPEGDGYQVGTDVEHGLYLEKKPPQQGGREWLKPSLEQARPAMLAELSKRWF